MGTWGEAGEETRNLASQKFRDLPNQVTHELRSLDLPSPALEKLSDGESQRRTPSAATALQG